MRRFRIILLGLLVFGLLAAGGGWALLHTKTLWTWSGRQLVDFAQDRLYPKLSVQHIHGHPFTGITFEGVTLTSPQGEVITAKRLELRFSLWSLVKLEPVIGRLAVYEPRINLWRETDGSLNLSRVLRKRPPPPFRSIDLPEIIFEGGEVTFREGGHIKGYPGFDFRCALLVLHPKRPEQAVFVRRAMLTAHTAGGPLSIRTRLTYRRQELNLLTAEIYESSHLIAVLGGKGEFSGEPSAVLSGDFKLHSGETLRAFLPEWARAWNIGGKFLLEASPHGLKATASGQLNGAAFLLNGRLRKAAAWRGEVEMGLSEVSPDLLAPLSAPLAARLQGLNPVSVRLRAEGSGFAWPPASFEFRGAVSPLKYRQTEVRHLEFTVRGAGGEQTFHTLLKGNFGQLSLEARGPLQAPTQGTIKVEAVDLKPFLLGIKSPPDARLSGAFAGQFSLPAGLDPERLKMTGEFKGFGRLGDFPPVECRGTVAWEQPGLKVSQASLKMGDLTAEFKGALTREGCDIQGQGKLPPHGMFPWPEPLAGQVTLAFEAKGPWGAPDISLQGEGRHLSWRGYGIQSARLKAAAQGWPPAAGNLDLQAAHIKAGSWELPQAFVTCQGSDHRWRFHLKTPSASGPQGEVRGFADLNRRPLLLTVEQAAFWQRGIEVKNDAPVKIALAPGVVVEPALFTLNGGKVALEGRMQDAGVSGRLEVREVPAEVFRFPGLPLKGLLQGRMTLAGSPQRPVLQGQLRAGPGQVSEFSFNTLETSLSYKDALLTISGLLAEKTGGPRLRWEGKLPLEVSLKPLQWHWGEADVHVLIRGENANLAMLTALTGELQEAEGPLDLLAEWRGPVRQPQLTGHCRWGPGSIRLRQAGTEYRLLPGAIRLQGNTLVIPELTLESQGPARFSGKMTLDGFLPQRVEVKGSLHDFKALERSGSEAIASGQVILQGPWDGALLKGNINLPQASFRTSFFQTGEHDDIVMVQDTQARQALGENGAKRRIPAVYQNLTMDLTLSSPEGAWVRSKRLKVKVAGSLKVGKAKAADEVYAKGVLKIKEGAVDVQGREFQVTRGEVHLPGTPDTPVTATMRAFSKVSDVTLVLDFHGPVNKPDVELSSEPPLPPADVLAYLVFNRPSQALTQQQFRTMGEQAMGILGGFTAKKLKDFLGKDFPLVGDVYMQGNKESMGVAKPLTKDLTVSFERKTEPLARDDTNQVRMDYRFNRHLTIESQLGRRNSGADVLFKVDF